MRHQILDVSTSFDDAMSSYYESDSVREDTRQFNICYLKLRNRLLPEEQKMLDGIYFSMEKSGLDLAKAAFSCGLATGQSRIISSQSEMEPEC